MRSRLAAAVFVVAIGGTAVGPLTVDVGRTDGSILLLSFGGTRLLTDFGLCVRESGATIPQNRYNSGHFTGVEVRRTGDGYLITGEITGKYVFSEKIQFRDNALMIEYQVTPLKTVTAALSMTGVINVASPVSQVKYWADGQEASFLDQAGDPTGLSGRKTIGWKLRDGTAVKITPLDNNAGDMNIQDIRKWKGFPFVFNVYSGETGWQGKEVKEGRTVRFGLVITVEGPGDGKQDKP